MNPSKPAPSRSARITVLGLAIVGLMLLAFMLVYLSAIRATVVMGDGDFSRVSTWPLYLFSAGALATIIWRRRRLTWPMGQLGFALAGLVWLGAFAYFDLNRANTTAATTLLAFLAGSVVLPATLGVRVTTLHQPGSPAWPSLLLGLRISLPVAIMYLAYSFLTNAAMTWQDPILAILRAVQSAIVGEVVFRFFIINVCLALLVGRLPRSLVTVATLFLAIVPYGLFQVSTLWMSNFPAAFAAVILNSLLFGLPAAYLQWRKDLESAISFHWLVDFLRAWAGLL